MCELCMSFPCLSGCPNEEEAPVVATCATCGEPIYKGEEAADIDGNMHHVECLENITTRELLGLFGCFTYPAGE